MKRAKYRFPEDFDKAPEGVWFYQPEGVDVIINDPDSETPTYSFLSRSNRHDQSKAVSARGATPVRTAKPKAKRPRRSLEK